MVALGRRASCPVWCLDDQIGTFQTQRPANLIPIASGSRRAEALQVTGEAVVTGHQSGRGRDLVPPCIRCLDEPWPRQGIGFTTSYSSQRMVVIVKTPRLGGQVRAAAQDCLGDRLAGQAGLVQQAGSVTVFNEGAGKPEVSDRSAYAGVGAGLGNQ